MTAVPEEHHLRVLFSTGLSDDGKGEVLEKWVRKVISSKLRESHDLVRI